MIDGGRTGPPVLLLLSQTSHLESLMSRRPGFTLMELLMVISVITILAVVLLPVCAQVRASTQTATCLSNQRQLGEAVSLYTQDYDECFPQTHPTATPWTFPEDEITLVTPWRTLMEPYVRSPRLFRCPSDWGAPNWHPTTYAPNGYTVYGASLAAVEQPSNTIYSAELQPGALLDDFSPWDGAESLMDTLAVSRHSGGAIYLFVDGHAKRLSYEQTWLPVNRYVLSGR